MMSNPSASTKIDHVTLVEFCNGSPWLYSVQMFHLDFFENC